MHEFPRGISNTRGKKKMNEGIHMWKCKLRMWKFSFAGEKANQFWKCLLHLLLSFLHFLYHLNFYLLRRKMFVRFSCNFIQFPHVNRLNYSWTPITHEFVSFSCKMFIRLPLKMSGSHFSSHVRTTNHMTVFNLCLKVWLWWNFTRWESRLMRSVQTESKPETLQGENDQ